MKKKKIYYYFIIFILLTLSIAACNYGDLENRSASTAKNGETAPLDSKEIVMPDYISLDNENQYKLDQSSIVTLDNIINSTIWQETIDELYKKIPFKLLRENKGVYYTIYRVDTEKLCYVYFKDSDIGLCIDKLWLYTSSLISKNELQEVAAIGESVDWDEFLNMDEDMIDLGLGSEQDFWISLKEGQTVEVDIEHQGKVLDIRYSDKSVYDFILDKDKPENILGNIADKKNKHGVQINVDNTSTFKYEKEKTNSLKEISDLMFTESEDKEIFKDQTLHYNNGIYYTVYYLENQKLFYVIFEEDKDNLCIENYWIYSDTQITKERFEEVVSIEKPINWDELLDIDDKISLGTAGSFDIYWISLKDGNTAIVKITYPDEVTEIRYSDKSIYDFILDKDKPENILNERS